MFGLQPLNFCSSAICVTQKTAETIRVMLALLTNTSLVELREFIAIMTHCLY